MASTPPAIAKQIPKPKILPSDQVSSDVAEEKEYYSALNRYPDEVKKAKKNPEYVGLGTQADKLKKQIEELQAQERALRAKQEKLLPSLPAVPDSIRRREQEMYRELFRLNSFRGDR